MEPDPQASMQVGMRVVRGVDWKWGSQDSGEGNVGTVVEIGRTGSPTTPDKTVVVQWDQGNRTNYRTGFQGAYDLLLYDNAQIGVRHPNIICDCCKKHGIRGMRWKCKMCFDYDLCTQCYMNNKHDLGHSFERYETAHSQPVLVSPRQNLTRITLKGTFQGAKVVRGPDWEWGNQDGKPAELQRKESTDRHPFQHGDKVKCLLDIDILREMQEGHGGWNPKMAEFIGQTGTVHRITDRGDVRVQFNSETRWTFHPGALTKLNTFWVGDVVRVIDDMETVKRFQPGHGEWTDEMAPTLGHIGKVIKVYGDGDLRVAVGGQSWTFNPACLTAYQREEEANLMTTDSAKEPKSTLVTVLEKLLSQRTESEHAGCLVICAALNNAAKVRELLQKYPDKASLESKNIAEVARLLLAKGASADLLNNGQCTPLMVAVSQGFTEVLRALCELNCDVNLPDAHGDTPLHCAITLDDKAAIEILTEVPNIDFTVQNSQGFNLLHYSSLKGNKLGGSGGFLEHFWGLDCQQLMALAVEKCQGGMGASLLSKLQASGFLGSMELNVGTAIACYLAQEGADINYANHRGKSPLDLITDGRIVQIVKDFSQKFR
ncbi:E3 ubiquitin-protein ligase MIB2 [Malurus melanocephalus]|uniref:E3 ubiquitin-protein ligase MIB2 n=1 Tax=Malurus melanocephalus TaxID=175006 RepID=UPI00254823EC|nr:E3 ubiquitin-protein ligase MIB2 [Malurus melanocephalus]